MRKTRNTNVNRIGQTSVAPDAQSSGHVRTQFKQLLQENWELRPAGQARQQPESLLSRYLPRHLIRLGEHRYYLTDVKHDNQFRFFVAYVQLFARSKSARKKRTIHPRIFYKDSSLIWRVATHYIKSESEHWIGKGDVKAVEENGERVWYSAEETTNLPYEIQNALDIVSRRIKRPHADRQALQLVLRNAPDDRVRPYEDFSKPRRLAMNDPRKAIYGNRLVARFKNPSDPASLWIAKDFEPDFANGLIDASLSSSTLYGGAIQRFRILSLNRKIQYMFMHGPTQSWLIPPQAMIPEIISYGVRAVDVQVEEHLCIPGYEYYFLEYEDDPNSLLSQIPAGYVGAVSLVDPQRSDASAWNHAMPVMKKFHRALPRLAKVFDP